MCRLFETIQIDNGQIMHSKWHEQRMVMSRAELWDLKDQVSLNDMIIIPEEWKTGKARCKIVYSPQVESVTFTTYNERKINSLKLIECDDIDYHLKRTNRTLLDDLFSKRGTCDEIIIVRNGFITDSSVSNLIFFNGNEWITPEMPLLNGTCRQRLIHEGKISERKVFVDDLKEFEGLKLINALRQPDSQEMIPLTAIRF